MKINEIEGFPKYLLKKKSLPLYKSFIIKDDFKEMKIDTSFDALAISEEDAINKMVNDMSLEEIDNFQKSIPIVVSFAIIKLDLEDLSTKDLVDNSDSKFEDGLLLITLRDKIFKVDVSDKVLKDIVIDIDEKTEIKKCHDILLEKE